MGTITDAERAAALAASGLGPKYDTGIDRESAHEILARRAEAAALAAGEGAPEDREFTAARRYSPGGSSSGGKGRSSRSDSVGEAFAKSFARQLGTQAGRTLVRGVLGGLFRSR